MYKPLIAGGTVKHAQKFSASSLQKQYLTVSQQTMSSHISTSNFLCYVHPALDTLRRTVSTVPTATDLSLLIGAFTCSILQLPWTNSGWQLSNIQNTCSRCRESWGTAWSMQICCVNGMDIRGVSSHSHGIWDVCPPVDHNLLDRGYQSSHNAGAMGSCWDGSAKEEEKP